MFNYFFFENRAVDKVMWKNIVDPGRWQYGACALHAGYVSYSHTVRKYNTYCCLIATVVARTCLNITS